MLIATLKGRLHDAPVKIDRPSDTGLQVPMQGLLGYQLRRAWLAMAADLGHRLDALSLTGMSLSVLLMIEANPGVSQSELARQLEIKRANMTPLAAQFADRGLIERRATDGRSHGLRLTAAGHRLVHAAWASVAENERRFLSRLPPEQQDLLRDLLVALRREDAGEPASGADPAESGS